MAHDLTGKRVAFLAAPEGVEQAELTEPFAQLLTEHGQVAGARTQTAPDALTTLDVVKPCGSRPGRDRATQGADRSRPASVLVTTFWES